jgi:hypothetical protein
MAADQWRQALEIFEQLGLSPVEIDWQHLYKKITPSDGRDEPL